MSFFEVLKGLFFDKPLHMQFEQALIEEESRKQAEQPKVEETAPVEKPKRTRTAKKPTKTPN